MVSWPVCLDVKHSSGAQRPDFSTIRELRTGLYFTIAAGPRQCSDSQIRVSQVSRSHFTDSDLIVSKPGAPAPSIYIRQEQGTPVVTPGTGFLSYPLLRLAGL
jgi:hypothetical protein